MLVAFAAKFTLLLSGAALVSLPSTAKGYERLPQALAKLSPADFMSKVRIASDPSGNKVVLSTRDGYDRARRVSGAHVNDIHLLALVDRRTGQVTWQVWHELVTASRHQRITAVRYTASGKLRTVQPIGVGHWLGDCPPTDAVGMCSHFTRVGFELPEGAVREIASTYAAGSRTPWHVRFEDASGKAVTSGLAPAEAAGLVQALDEWRNRSGKAESGMD